VLQFASVKTKGEEKIGLQGFEPWTSCTRGRRSTKLSHSPKFSTMRDSGRNPRTAQRPYFAHFAEAGK
jgi:hypothetical protein